METAPSLTHEDYAFVLAILDRILLNWEDVKYKRLKRIAVSHVSTVLALMGFREDAMYLSLPDSVGIDAIRNAHEWCQDKVDETRDPETITFRQVAEILKRDGKLPNIRTDIDDFPLDDPSEPPEDVRPPKPWEIS